MALAASRESLIVNWPVAAPSSRSAWSGRSTSSLALTSRWTSLGGGLLMRRIIALDLDQNRDYSLYCDPRVDYSLYCDPRSAQPRHPLRHRHEERTPQ